MKYVSVRVLEQYDNLTEYFLNFLPKNDKSFKSSIATTARYQRIKAALTDNFTEAYVSFCAFAANEFEKFLLPFQGGEPIIHLLYHV